MNVFSPEDRIKTGLKILKQIFLFGSEVNQEYTYTYYTNSVISKLLF